MPIYPFERIIYPKRYPSPFLTGGTGPGGIGDSIERAEGEKIEGGGTGRRRARRAATGQTHDHAGPRYGTFVGAANALAQAGGGSAGVPQPLPQPQPAVHIQQKRTEDRSIGTAAGGLANLQGNAVVEVLPAETGRPECTSRCVQHTDVGEVKHFDRDPETNQVLWFSGPPIDVARTPAPQYSLKYLHHVAIKKRQQRVDEQKQEEEEEREEQADITLDSPQPEKRRRIGPRPRMSDTLAALWTRSSGGS
jgi:chromatin structure-remodeling complex subunit RSC1/2